MFRKEAGSQTTQTIFCDSCNRKIDQEDISTTAPSSFDIDVSRAWLESPTLYWKGPPFVAAVKSLTIIAEWKYFTVNDTIYEWYGTKLNDYPSRALEVSLFNCQGICFDNILIRRSGHDATPINYTYIPKKANIIDRDQIYLRGVDWAATTRQARALLQAQEDFRKFKKVSIHFEYM